MRAGQGWGLEVRNDVRAAFGVYKWWTKDEGCGLGNGTSVTVG